ncbi:MAG: hypothetical protein FWB93_03570 [Oscillospiraceae bacterium]|nr:hypothetical protein [Oscillospiraceae bacterium]
MNKSLHTKELIVRETGEYVTIKFPLKIHRVLYFGAMAVASGSPISCSNYAYNRKYWQRRI